MAIGLALLLGFRFPQNFDGPYTATSLQDFWRRWHMTLSRWLRDYLYIPLGGNRGGDGRPTATSCSRSCSAGLWHGAAWTFVVWGAIHGGVLSLRALAPERAHEPRACPTRPTPLLRRIGQRILTFKVVCFAWVFFRAESLANACDVITATSSTRRNWGSASPLVTFGCCSRSPSASAGSTCRMT